MLALLRGVGKQNSRNNKTRGMSLLNIEAIRARHARCRDFFTP
jgi:hypothetical protein